VETVREALGLRDEGGVPAQAERPTLPKGKPVSDIELCVRATRAMNEQYEATPGGGKLRDGSPAPRSMLSAAYANRTASPREKRRLRGGL
jgi:hypothetical protein